MSENSAAVEDPDIWSGYAKALTKIKQAGEGFENPVDR
jgi:hypothetical protein